VFTARYALSPYIQQIRSVFKGLKVTERVVYVPQSKGDKQNDFISLLLYLVMPYITTLCSVEW
jgi:hypothetical protein